MRRLRAIQPERCQAPGLFTEAQPAHQACSAVRPSARARSASAGRTRARSDSNTSRSRKQREIEMRHIASRRLHSAGSASRRAVGAGMLEAEVAHARAMRRQT
jgi:hypothetical protein